MARTSVYQSKKSAFLKRKAKRNSVINLQCGFVKSTSKTRESVLVIHVPKQVQPSLLPGEESRTRYIVLKAMDGIILGRHQCYGMQMYLKIMRHNCVWRYICQGFVLNDLKKPPVLVHTESDDEEDDDEETHADATEFGTTVTNSINSALIDEEYDLPLTLIDEDDYDLNHLLEQDDAVSQATNDGTGSNSNVPNDAAPEVFPFLFDFDAPGAPKLYSSRLCSSASIALRELLCAAADRLSDKTKNAIRGYKIDGDRQFGLGRQPFNDFLDMLASPTDPADDTMFNAAIVSSGLLVPSFNLERISSADAAAAPAPILPSQPTVARKRSRTGSSSGSSGSSVASGSSSDESSTPKRSKRTSRTSTPRNEINNTQSLQPVCRAASPLTPAPEYIGGDFMSGGRSPLAVSPNRVQARPLMSSMLDDLDAFNKWMRGQDQQASNGNTQRLPFEPISDLEELLDPSSLSFFLLDGKQPTE